MKNFFTRFHQGFLERRTIHTIALFVIIGVIFYLAAVFWLGWQKAMTAFSDLGMQTLLVGIIISSSSYLWRFARWEHSLQCLGSSVPRLKHLGIYLSGLALTATPGKAGETFRSALLIQHGVKVTNSLAAFLVDRGADVLGMILLGMLAAIIAGHNFAFLWLLSFAFVLLGSRSFAYLLLHPVASAGWGNLGRYIKWLPVKGGQATLEAWAKIWTLPKVSAFTLLAILSYGTQSLVFSWFCHILRTGISVADCVLIFVQATLLGAASMMPGGLGAMEAALVYQLLERGVSEGIAMSLAISIRLVTLWFGMLTGVIALLFLSAQAVKFEKNC